MWFLEGLGILALIVCAFAAFAGCTELYKVIKENLKK